MCCTDPAALALPASVAAALARYEQLSVEDTYPGEWTRSRDEWLHARVPFLRGIGAAPPVVRNGTASGFAAWTESHDFPAWVRKTVGDQPPPDLVVVRITPQGRLGPIVSRPPWLLPGRLLRRHLLVDSSAPTDVAVVIGEEAVVVPAYGARLAEVGVGASHPSIEVRVGDADPADLQVARVARKARVRLRAGMACRWSVVDDEGGAWFPDGVLRKYDVHDRPFFHGDDLVVEVPATRLAVGTRRGLEYRPSEAVVEPRPGDETLVEVAPQRWMDPSAQGWLGADLHVHMNYSAADQVCAPHDAARMQLGEGLHFMNLVAANQRTALVYDREALEEWAGQDLPWSDSGTLARMGLEYRNDMFGHFHATGLDSPPPRYHTGHPGSDEDEDWPPNATALRQARGSGAVTGYCHPVFQRFSEHSPPDLLFTRPHTIECRELVADAALGLVDSFDIASNGDNLGAAVIYRRLLGAGVRLAVTAGTDVMLSLPRFHIHSNPPGWARVYASIDGPLSLDAFTDAIRGGRTMATNGPWLGLDVEGHGPGDRIDATAGSRLRVRASAYGPGVRRLRLYTSEGVLAEAVAEQSASGLDGHASVSVEAQLATNQPDYVVAEADGTAHPEVLQATAFAHTSAVHVDVDGRAVATPEDIGWCLKWLDCLEDLCRRHGVFSSDVHREEVMDMIESARRVYRGNLRPS